jgi:hypothetical protein
MLVYFSQTTRRHIPEHSNFTVNIALVHCFLTDTDITNSMIAETEVSKSLLWNPTTEYDPEPGKFFVPEVYISMQFGGTIAYILHFLNYAFYMGQQQETNILRIIHKNRLFGL